MINGSMSLAQLIEYLESWQRKNDPTDDMCVECETWIRPNGRREIEYSIWSHRRQEHYCGSTPLLALQAFLLAMAPEFSDDLEPLK